MKLSIIIPCFNEEKTISEVLKRIDGADLGSTEKEIIIVNDGSTDGSRQALENLKEKYKFILLNHKNNLGKGQAIRTALRYVSGDYVIIQDADLEYNPADYKKLLECALNNNAKVVYGSRRLNHKGGYSHLSFYLGGIFLTWLVNILYGIKITDEATGYKLFKTEIIKNIKLGCKGFEFCPEITAKIAKKGIKICEVPIIYFPRSEKDGKKIKWQDGFKAVWVLIKYKFIN
jgi:glycosyltransferase involved in cell wall biosynthesis